MRVIAKIIETVGITILFIGLGGMDSASTLIPIVSIFTGMAIMLAGVSIEEVCA